jgi:hypothetical protein
VNRKTVIAAALAGLVAAAALTGCGQPSQRATSESSASTIETAPAGVQTPGGTPANSAQPAPAAPSKDPNAKVMW